MAEMNCECGCKQARGAEHVNIGGEEYVAAVEQERDALRTLAHANDQQIAALEQRVRELSADLEFANRKTRELETAKKEGLPAKEPG